MKIVLFGDSITDMHRDRNNDNQIYSYGCGYPFVIASRLFEKDPLKYEILNRGIGGSKSVDLYSRIKADVWNQKPDVLSILVGTNDCWHDIDTENSLLDFKRFENTYRLMIEETKEILPECKIILMEPFLLEGKNTNERTDDVFAKIRKYADVVKKLAKEYDLPIVLLQDELTKKAKEFKPECYLFDGVHPMVAGATLIANEWLKVFERIDK